MIKLIKGILQNLIVFQSAMINFKIKELLQLSLLILTCIKTNYKTPIIIYKPNKFINLISQIKKSSKLYPFQVKF